jgi:hypothetical protein
VFGYKSKKPRERFYLLPGQGGKNYYRKQKRIMRWTISVAVMFGLVIAVVMWWQAHPHL